MSETPRTDVCKPGPELYALARELERELMERGLEVYELRQKVRDLTLAEAHWRKEWLRVTDVVLKNAAPQAGSEYSGSDSAVAGQAPAVAAPEWDRVERRKDNWTLIVKEYWPKLGFQYKDNDGNEYEFFGLVHAEDDYYYGLMRKDRTVILATCVGGLEQMYERIPNGGRCILCNGVLPITGGENCDRFRCPFGPNPL